MDIDRTIRATVAGLLHVSARVLSLTSTLTQSAAQRLRPDLPAPPAGPPGPARAPERSMADQLAERRVKAEPPPTVAVPEGPARVRAPETHAAELAQKPASEVVAEIAHLSTDELGALYEHEQANKRRKTVLAAIESAAAEHT
jgi:hypothetical protein